MLAKDIAENLTHGHWEKVNYRVNEATLYTKSTTRIRVNIEEFKLDNGGFFISENEDPIASDKDFVSSFMSSIGKELCANQEMELITALVAQLKDWRDHPKMDKNKKDFVNEFLKSLSED